LGQFTNPRHPGSKRPVVAAEAFRSSIAKDAHRNIADAGCRNVSSPRTNFHNGSGSAARLAKRLVDQLKCGCYSRGRVRAKDSYSFTSSFAGEGTVSQTIDYHRAQSSRYLDHFPRISTDFLTLNGNTDTIALKNA
jgi:hypothetical protein